MDQSVELELFNRYCESVRIWQNHQTDHNFMVARANYEAFMSVYFDQIIIH